MPELPEVETVRRGLKELLVGYKIAKVNVLRDKSYPNDSTVSNSLIVGAKITDVRRRGKVLIIDLNSAYSLLIHLKMTGQLVYRSEKKQNFGAGHPTDSLVANLPDNSTRVIFELDDARLFFNDQRVFGWVKIIPSSEINNHEFISKLGPEPLEKEFTLKAFNIRLKSRKKSRIKVALLDQTVVAGIGNIYADEALWLSKIHPKTTVERISDNQLSKLHKSIIKVLKLGLEKGGSTDKNYRDAEGQKGSYLKFANVFRKEGQPCSRCGTEIIKIRVAGRGTHICPKCQKKR